MPFVHDYADLLNRSRRVAFRLEDVLPADAGFDFTRPFLPDSLARTETVSFLSPSERLLLNQIRGHSYLATLGLFEECILPFVLDHARADQAGAEVRAHALGQFAGEEAKHIELFKRCRARFQADFGTPCEIVGPASAVTNSVLARGPLAVALTILHIEWMTQRHYLESLADSAQRDPLFQSLLKHHFIEECQHAELDGLIVHELACSMSARELDASVRAYGEILADFAALIAQQVELDLRAFEHKSGRVLSIDEIEGLRLAQFRAACFTFLSAGLEHPRLRETVLVLSEDGEAQMQEIAERLP